MHKTDFLDGIWLFGVLAMMSIYILGHALSLDVYGGITVPYYHHVLTLLAFGIVSFFGKRPETWCLRSSITLVVWLWIFWVLVTSLNWIVEDPANKVYNYILPALCCPLIYQFFYAFTRSNVAAKQLLIFYFFAMLIFTGALFLKVYFFRNSSGTSQLTQVTEVYIPLLTLPWILIASNRIWRFLGTVAIIILVYISVKRGALLALTASLLVYIFIQQITSTQAWIKRILFPVLLLAIGVAIFISIDQSRDHYFSSRLASLEEDEGSGRIEIFQETISMIEKSSIQKKLLGHGHDTVVENSVVGCSAHNDWLEVIYDFGFGGLILYVSLHLCLMTMCFKLVRKKSRYAAPFAASYMLFFVMSAISHLIIYAWCFMFMTAFWGTIIGLTDLEIRTASNRTVVTHRMRDGVRL